MDTKTRAYSDKAMLVRKAEWHDDESACSGSPLSAITAARYSRLAAVCGMSFGEDKPAAEGFKIIGFENRSGLVVVEHVATGNIETWDSHWTRAAEALVV